MIPNIDFMTNNNNKISDGGEVIEGKQLSKQQ